ncbi:adenine nucleotide alpha hydrolase [Reichenbachiella ulvae]|uniref:Adenine nucleotide alpha hydrolase n=1 Tax=Reichenbachiella ulvae TaxID=2980104 RepID=A0ABT3CQB1_9BACT|nr:adenine nucleotide alpha hydrolase [Reichenbachiella ulvae]MCV9385756.1 adenine nucleotide alpha hydrolase [Reichenbachiella ulvae]
MKPIPVSVSWSGGKDSAYMLYLLLNDPTYQVVELHTALSADLDRVSMHGVPKNMIEAQAASFGLPIHFLSIPEDKSNDSYEKELAKYYDRIKKMGVYHVASGDIFLEDLKVYRDKIFSTHSITGVYPLWKIPTDELITKILNIGFKTVICTAKKELFTESICGKVLNEEIIQSFGPKIDPCGENGEFHSFVFDGPIFNSRIEYEILDTLEKTYVAQTTEGELRSTFEFADLKLKR